MEAGFLAGIFADGPRRWLRRSIDVLRLAILAEELDGSDPATRDYALSSAASRFGVPVEQSHHAFDDALTTAQLFLVLANKLAEHGYDTPGRLIRASRSVGSPVRLA